ncbi:putative disease resistance protein At3g14460 isoform X2 [Ziziphus jujuba]|uniref:Disease resistance protein At3g14460 isoform X2 n=1 Tax=Ziziphus jujuba TaxID=326968 RepID=A0ABM4AH53_ZIZJJ|nr:putative disease resistance protein At3g14460 isoform X2 [Ziziphus jujuba]XP_060676050.1 putative disease resistance protein At3g14460 isoform X2 [Ziziphus jujuba]
MTALDIGWRSSLMFLTTSMMCWTSGALRLSNPKFRNVWKQKKMIPIKKQLIRRRFGYNGRIVSCKMHDILHDFAQFLTRNECSVMRVQVDMEERERPGVEKVRHSWLSLAPNFPKIPISIFVKGNLRSLFIDCTSDTSLGDENMVFFHQDFRYLKHLRTLALRSSGITKVPEQIGQLIHLRHLCMYNSMNLQELADEVCDLCNLQTLILQGCSRLQRLPEGMGKLVNLRQLYMRGCSALVGLPKGIGGLTQLQTLDTMVIPKKNEAAYFLSLGDLKRLNHLRFQTSFFEIRNCCNLINPSRSELMYWECLVNVFLDFGGIDKKEEIRDEEDEFGILEALQPHPSLRYLRIKQYKGTNLYPKWMMGLDRLTGLDFIDCKQCESLPPLGRLLPSLAVLRIDGLDKVKKIGDEFLGLGVEQVEAVSFPKLKWLFFYNMRDWEDWEGTAGTSLQPGVMPCLKVLEIENCGNLKSLPPYLKHTPLHILRINASGVLSQSLQNSEEEFTNISRITRIFVDGQELENNS